MPALDRALQRRLVDHVMTRDRVSEEVATKIVEGLGIGDISRLELEMRDQSRTDFTAEHSMVSLGDRLDQALPRVRDLSHDDSMALLEVVEDMPTASAKDNSQPSANDDVWS